MKNKNIEKRLNDLESLSDNSMEIARNTKEGMKIRCKINIEALSTLIKNNKLSIEEMLELNEVMNDIIDRVTA